MASSASSSASAWSSRTTPRRWKKARRPSRTRRPSARRPGSTMALGSSRGRSSSSTATSSTRILPNSFRRRSCPQAFQRTKRARRRARSAATCCAKRSTVSTARRWRQSHTRSPRATSRFARIQPQADNRYAVFDVIPRQTLSAYTERNPADPRLEHAMTLTVDAFGNVRESLHVAYARKGATAGPQAQTLITYNQADYVPPIAGVDYYRVDLLRESRTYELTSLPAPAANGVYTFAQVAALIPTAEIDFSAAPPATPRTPALRAHAADVPRRHARRQRDARARPGHRDPPRRRHARIGHARLRLARGQPEAALFRRKVRRHQRSERLVGAERRDRIRRRALLPADAVHRPFRQRQRHRLRHRVRALASVGDERRRHALFDHDDCRQRLPHARARAPHRPQRQPHEGRERRARPRDEGVGHGQGDRVRWRRRRPSLDALRVPPRCRAGVRLRREARGALATPTRRTRSSSARTPTPTAWAAKS